MQEHTTNYDPFLETSTFAIIQQMELDSLAWELEKWARRLRNDGFNELVEYWEHEQYLEMVRKCFVCPKRTRPLRATCKLELAAIAERLDREHMTDLAFNTITHALFSGFVEE